MDIGQNIKRIRKEKGLTQRKLGELCGINEANIRKYELGGANPKIETIQKIALALGVSTDYLRGYSEYKEALIKNNPALKAFNSEELKSGLGKDLLDHIELEYLNITEDKRELIFNYNQLNESGQKEALKRVQELTEIPKYKKEETE